MSKLSAKVFFDLMPMPMPILSATISVCISLYTCPPVSLHVYSYLMNQEMAKKKNVAKNIPRSRVNQPKSLHWVGPKWQI